MMEEESVVNQENVHELLNKFDEAVTSKNVFPGKRPRHPIVQELLNEKLSEAKAEDENDEEYVPEEAKPTDESFEEENIDADELIKSVDMIRAEMVDSPVAAKNVINVPRIRKRMSLLETEKPLLSEDSAEDSDYVPEEETDDFQTQIDPLILAKMKKQQAADEDEASSDGEEAEFMNSQRSMVHERANMIVQTSSAEVSSKESSVPDVPKEAVVMEETEMENNLPLEKTEDTSAQVVDKNEGDRDCTSPKEEKLQVKPEPEQSCKAPVEEAIKEVNKVPDIQPEIAVEKASPVPTTKTKPSQDVVSDEPLTTKKMTPAEAIEVPAVEPNDVTGSKVMPQQPVDSSITDKVNVSTEATGLRQRKESSQPLAKSKAQTKPEAASTPKRVRKATAAREPFVCFCTVL